jgi:predicted dehydrogenase
VLVAAAVAANLTAKSPEAPRKEETAFCVAASASLSVYILVEVADFVGKRHMNQVRWGVLSTAKIAREKVIPATQASETGLVTAIASRDLSRAKKVATALNIERAYGSYQELLSDRNVDAVYIPLPNHLHVRWSMRALSAGKHVLCEKPIALTVAEAEQLAGAAAAHPKLTIMEAFMYRFHPQWQTARKLVQEGRIGQLRTIHTHFSYYNDDPQNIRNQHDIGGGALMDIGCYPISLSRFIFDAEPQRVLGHVERDPTMKIDRLTSALLEFFQGTATFTCATQLVPYQRVNIWGTSGRIEIEIPFNAPTDQACRMWVQIGTKPETPIEEVRFGVADQYRLQADAFGRAIQEGAPAPTPLADAVANMQVIERVLASSKTGGWT